jgi:hypothetical protein
MQRANPQTGWDVRENIIENIYMPVKKKVVVSR